MTWKFIKEGKFSWKYQKVIFKATCLRISRNVLSLEIIFLVSVSVNIFLLIC